MIIAEQKLNLFRQIDQLPEEALLELEKIVVQLKAAVFNKSVKQKQNNSIEKIMADFYKLPVSELETLNTPLVYQGKVLSLDEMEQAVDCEAGLHQ